MAFKRFSFLVSLRAILLVATLVIFATIFGDDRLLFNQIILGSIIAFQIFELVRYVNKTNRELTKFFDGIKQSDFTLSFTREEMGRSFRDLHQSMQSLIDSYKEVKIEREAQYHLLETIMRNVPVGIIVLSEKNLITNINEAARRLLMIPDIHSWKLLESKVPQFTRHFTDLAQSGSFIVEVNKEHVKRTLTVSVTQFELLEKQMRLITFMDIKSQLEQREVEAWHRLIRILTHEIMNSVTPISSMAETLETMMESNKGKTLTEELEEDLIFSVKTIQKRSDGLLGFVEDYRKLTRTPRPDKNEENVNELLWSVRKLMEADMRKNEVDIVIEVEDSEKINLDRKQIEQVLINLLKNSSEAMEEQKEAKIVLSCNKENDHLNIVVEDNGPGIAEDILNDIWIPFYTTKEKGSGIGLSLSKQIMKLHDGDLKVETDSQSYTRFILEFPD